MVRSAIRTAFDAGSDGAETFMVKPTDAELVAEFAGTADRVRDVGQTPSKIVVKVDIYTTALGTLRVTVNREIKTRSEEHTSELQSLMRISYSVFCLKKKKK